MINAYDWYWLAEDGRVYGSKNQAVVNESDVDYLAWKATFTPPEWPRDLEGNQTDAELQAVLAPHGLYANLAYYTANARYQRQIAGITVTSLSSAAFASDPLSRNTINSAYDYAQANPARVFNWKMRDGSFVALDKNKMTTLMNNMVAYVQACYDLEYDIVEGVNSGNVTNQEQVDIAFAAISNVFP